MGRQWPIQSLFTTKCFEYSDSKERGDLIGTAFTIRDMMQIVDALEDDGLLRYWGENNYCGDVQVA
jgi:hypothetical protein